MSIPLQEVLEGKYEILEKIGEGGIGAVYKVRHRLLDEVRVIKVLRPQVAGKEELQRRFLHEAQMAFRMRHANIARLYDFAVAVDGRAYIVMEYIDGVGLDEMLQVSGPASVGLAVEISSQALAALHYLHKNDFIHRDVSPDNLMVSTGYDHRPLVKLIDLGIAKNLSNEAQLTATGVFLGKVRYCSPEQFSAGDQVRQKLDRRSDIYSYGVVLYELLTGEYPFRGATFGEIAGSHLFQPPRDFDESDPEGKIPDGVRAAVLKALAKEAADRFADAGEFADALAVFAQTDGSYKSEFDRSFEITATALPRPRDYLRPGSTQDRLDHQFDLITTTTPAPLDPPRRPHERPWPERSEDRVDGDRPGLPGYVRLLIGAAGLVVVAAGALWYFLLRPGAAAERTVEVVDPGPPAGAILFEGENEPRWDAAGVEAPFIEWGDPTLLQPPLSEVEEAEARAAALAAAAAARAASAAAAAAAEESTPAVDEEAVEAELPPEPEPAPPEPERVQTVYEPGVGVMAPVQLTAAQPPYPPNVRRRKEPVKVVVGVLIDEFGTVIRTSVKSGRRGFRPYAEAAARDVTFRPASKDGVLGRMWTEVRIVFSTEETGEAGADRP